MKLYLYETEVLRQKGSALRGMIRNSSTPILDLLVRESIQNSLDAQDSRINSRFVNVEYLTGQFDKACLDRELDGISLAGRPTWSNRYIAICDSGTTGLTGNFDDDNGNLSKLVFGIYEAQQASGAGGCWGVGKTVYFRIGTGLVIYYSRVMTENGDYKSLLSVAFVEDETKASALLPAASDGKKYGIAWWGDPVPGKKRVREISDEKIINRILRTFNIVPYEGKKTGTVIVIPFIDEKSLLANNQPDREDGSPAPYWTSSIPEYIRYSVQKWYSARLCNRLYPFGKYLNISINHEPFDPRKDFDPFFRFIQALYNKAALTIVGNSEAENIHFGDTELLCEEVRVNSQINPNEAGRVAFAKVSRSQLGMTPPNNMPCPYEYIRSIVGEKDFGKPVILFCRKPGMVVSYKTEGDWTDGIPKTDQDEFLVAFFVLNGAPSLKKSSQDISLEDYVRKSEQADHLSWNDYTITEENLRPSIIEKIKGNTAKRIEAAIRETEDDSDMTVDTGLSSRIGKLLLPPEGFGRRPSTASESKTAGNRDHSGGSGTMIRRSLRYSYYISEFTKNGFVLSICVSTGKKKASSFAFSINADSTHGSINAEDWLNEVNISFPFSIVSARIVLSRVDEVKSLYDFSISHISDTDFSPLNVVPQKTTHEDWVGMMVRFDDEKEHSFDINLSLEVMVRRRDIRPSLSFE